MQSNFSSRLMCTFALAVTVAMGGCSKENASSLAAKGKADLANSDAVAAVIRFKAALQAEPDSIPIRVLLGRALLEAGDANGAIVELSRALAQKADPAEVMPLIARAHVQATLFRKLTDGFATVKLADKAAESDFKTSLAIAWGAIGNRAKSEEAILAAEAALPGSARTQTTHARMMLLSGSLDPALALVEKVIASDPKLHEAWQLKGDILAAKRSDEKLVEAAYAQALALKPRHVPAHAGIVTSRMRAGDVDGAKKQLEALRGVAPKGAETVFLDAQMALIAKDFRRAREGVQQLLKVAPDNVNLLQLAAAVEWQSGSLVIAERMLSNALRNDPALDQARINLGHIYLRLGQPARALATVTPLVRAEGQSAAALGVAGEASSQLGDLVAAEAFYSRAAAGSPQDTRARTSMALAQMAQGNAISAFAQLESLVKQSQDGYADAALVSARLGRKEFDAALVAADSMVRKQPNSAAAHETRGRVLLAKQDLQGARQAFEKAVAADPAALAPINQLAYLDILERRPEQAQPRFEAFLKVHPGSYLALLSLAELRGKMGAPRKEVQALLAEAIKAAPDEPDPRLNMIELLADQRQVKAALAAAQEAAVVLPDHLGVLDALGRMQILDGNSQQALSTFRRITIVDPNVSTAHLRMAGVHREAGNTSAAVASLRRALELDPRSKATRIALVDLLVGEKRSKEAIDLARDLQRRDPQASGGYLLEGAVLRKLKNNEGTIPVYRLGMRNAKEKSEIALNLFVALLASKDFKLAEPFAKEWLAANPQDGAMHYNLGEVYMTKGAFAEAESHFIAALKVRPDFILALNNLAWVMVQQGKPGAVGVVQQAVNQSPNQAVLLDTLALALAAEGQLPQALETMQKAVQLTPGDPGLRLRSAKLAIKAGDKTLARSELERVVSITASNPFRDEAAKLMKSL